MKQKIEALIDKLVDKSLTFGCRYLCSGYEGAGGIIVGYGVLNDIGDAIFHYIPKDKDGDMLRTFKSCIIPSSLLNKDKHFKVLGHLIYIGNVLEKIEHLPRYNTEYMNTAVSRWRECGFTKSLQEIYAECEWYDDGAPTKVEQYELFKFILSLNL